MHVEALFFGNSAKKCIFTALSLSWLAIFPLRQAIYSP